MSLEATARATRELGNAVSRDIWVQRVEPRGLRLLRALLVPVVAIGATFVLAVGVATVALMLLPLVMLVSALVVAFLLGRPRRLGRSGNARVEGRRVWIDERVIVAHARSGRLLPSAREGVLVELNGARLFGGSDLRVGSVDEGRALLAALGLDAARATARYFVLAPSIAHLRQRQRATAVAAATFVLAMCALAAGVELVVPIVAVAGLLTVGLGLSLGLSGEATVGTDGVLVRWLWQRRFVSLDAIASAAPARRRTGFGGRQVLVSLRDATGANVNELLVGARGVALFESGLDAEVDERAGGLAERIREAIAARGGARPVDAAALERGALPAAAWIARLRALGASTETFRAGAPPAETELLAVVEDAGAPTLRRAAAAIVATAATATTAASATARESGAASTDEATATRIRVAAEASAEPRLRVALAAATSGDDDALTAALEALIEAEDTAAREAARETR